MLRIGHAMNETGDLIHNLNYYDGIEFDNRLTEDGEFIICHAGRIRINIKRIKLLINLLRK